MITLPVEAYRRFRIVREGRLKIVRKEFVGLRGSDLESPGHQSLEVVEAQPVVLTKKIKEEGT